MTAQIPDELENESPLVDFGDLVPVSVVRGDISMGGERYEFGVRPEIPEDAEFWTSNWSGYTSRYRLHEDGSLELESYVFQMPEDRIATQPVGERLSGDFWMMMRSDHELFAATTYVPFVEGRIVVDRERWRVVPEGPVSQLRAIFKRPGVYTANGTAAEVFAYLAGCDLGMRMASGGFSCEPPPSSLKDELAALLGWVNDVAGVETRSGWMLFNGERFARLLEAFPDEAALFRAARTFLLGWPDERDAGA